MLKTAPATIANELEVSISSLLVNTIHYLDENSLQIRRLLADAKKLISADAYQGYVALGNIYHLCGNYEKMRISHRNSERLSSDVGTHGWSAACECNLGFSSVAQDHYRIVGIPTKGDFRSAFSLGTACGALHLLSEYIEQAEKMKIDLAGLPISDVKEAERVLSHAGISDSDVAAMLDLAGEVMREDRVFYSGDPESVIELDSGDSIDNACVHMIFRIALPGKVVAGMGVRLAEKIAERIESIPDQFHISFRPA